MCVCVCVCVCVCMYFLIRALVICVFGLRVFGYTRLRRIINIKKKKLFGLRRVRRCTRLLAALKREFLDVRLGNQSYTIFGHAQVKFCIYAIHSLCGMFRNLIPRISENPLQ